MSINQAPPTQWVPINDEIVDHLHARYCVWIDDLTEIRERMDALRDAHRMGWKPPIELQERLDDLNERDELYAAKHMDVARAFLEAANTDINATLQARTNRRCDLIAALVELRCAWEAGWDKVDTWTPDERSELIWLIYANPELKNLFNISAQNVLYFCQKLERLRRASEPRNPYRTKPNGNPYRSASRHGNPYRKKH
ncbi:hypothetical protein [Bradyrhizobium sp. LA6.7]|uniref:hypothetical protein n=1 Tax=unclassified Bradyrhizobium TaxID=2631580 RepID=UPI00339346B8